MARFINLPANAPNNAPPAPAAATCAVGTRLAEGRTIVCPLPFFSTFPGGILLNAAAVAAELPANAPTACRPTGKPTIRASGSPWRFSIVPLTKPTPRGPFSLYKKFI